MNKVKLAERSLEIAYKDEGEGAPVLLLHGFCGSSAYWDAIVPLLRAQCRLIVPDLPGHGSSGVPASTHAIEAFADDIVALLNRLGIEKAIWLGHSLGGYVALAAAERHADRLAALGLIHSTAYPDDEKGKENRLKSIQTVKLSGIPSFVDGLIPKLFAPEHIETMADKVEYAKQIGYGTSPEGAVAALTAMRERPDRNAVLSHTTYPVLLVAGAKDQIIQPEKTFSVRRDGVRQVQLEQAGHMSMMEAPQSLAHTIAEFIQS